MPVWFPVRPLSLACRWLTSPRVFTWPFPCAPALLGSLPLHIGKQSIGLGPLWFYLTLISFLKTLFPNTVMLGVKVSRCEFWGNKTQSLTDFTNRSFDFVTCSCRRCWLKNLYRFSRDNDHFTIWTNFWKKQSQFSNRKTSPEYFLFWFFIAV